MFRLGCPEFGFLYLRLGVLNLSRSDKNLFAWHAARCSFQGKNSRKNPPCFLANGRNISLSHSILLQSQSRMPHQQSIQTFTTIPLNRKSISYSLHIKPDWACRIAEGLRLEGTGFCNLPSDSMYLGSWVPQNQLGPEDTRNSLQNILLIKRNIFFYVNHFPTNDITHIVKIHILHFH